MIHLITYGDIKWLRAKRRLVREAKTTGWFDTITAYGPEDLDDEFKTKFANILNQSRGGGYWIWKTFIIKKRLAEIDDGDILIYLDSGCSINPEGNGRFDEYMDMLNNTDSISFQITLPEKHWTTREIFNHFNISTDSEICNTGQYQGGIRLMKKTQNTINITNLEWQTLHNNPLLFTDHYSSCQESYFRENRHDQSIYSVIMKMHNSFSLPDENNLITIKDKKLKYPFWVLCKRT